MNLRSALRNFLLLASVACVGPLHAALITKDAVDSGRYRADGFHDANSTNYLAGFCTAATCGVAGARRDFFVFDLSDVGLINSAELQVFNPAGGYVSAAGQDTYRLFAVATDINKLTADHAPGNAEGKAIFTDLGDGAQFGSKLLSTPNQVNNMILKFTLNQAAIDAINAIDGLFAIGGALNLVGNETADKYIFGNTDNAMLVRRLIVNEIPVPEPSTVVLLGTALLWFVPRIRRAMR